MNELIRCMECLEWGQLSFAKGPRMLHGVGDDQVVCKLPPRDNRLPRITPPPVPAPRWTDRYPFPYRRAS